MQRLTRSTRDKRISGLCGGLGAYLGISSSLLRLIVLISALCSFGTTLFLYIVASIFVPRESYGEFFDEYPRY